MRDREKKKDHSALPPRIKFTEFKTSITKEMDAEEFLQFVSEHKDRIISSRLILPKLGSNGFGKFIVEFE